MTLESPQRPHYGFMGGSRRAHTLVASNVFGRFYGCVVAPSPMYKLVATTRMCVSVHVRIRVVVCRVELGPPNPSTRAGSPDLQMSTTDLTNLSCTWRHGNMRIAACRRPGMEHHYVNCHVIVRGGLLDVQFHSSGISEFRRLTLKLPPFRFGLCPTLSTSPAAPPLSIHLLHVPRRTRTEFCACARA